MKDTFFRDMSVIFVARPEMVEKITMGSTNFFASKSLTAMLKSSVTTKARLSGVAVTDSNVNRLCLNTSPLVNDEWN